ncbi:hypothetical protein AB3538_04720 [Acinetobacter baumannii]
MIKWYCHNRTKFYAVGRELMQLWADYLDTLRQGGDVSVFKPHYEDNIIAFNLGAKSVVAINAIHIH